MATSSRRGHQDTMSRLEPGASSKEIFYCARPSCSALCYSKAELERHTLTSHAKAGGIEDIEDDFSFDSDEEEQQQTLLFSNFGTFFYLSYNDEKKLSTVLLRRYGSISNNEFTSMFAPPFDDNG